MSRDIGFLKWNDPLAWMESMKGSRWAAAVKKENLLYSTAVDLLSNPKILKQFEKSSKEHYIEDTYTCNNIIISSDMGSWKWIGGAMRSTAAVYSEGDLCWSIEEEGDGKEWTEEKQKVEEIDGRMRRWTKGRLVKKYTETKEKKERRSRKKEELEDGKRDRI
jgi:hypothetical protein